MRPVKATIHIRPQTTVFGGFALMVTDIQTDRQIYRCMDRHADRHADRYMDGWTYRRIDKLTDRPSFRDALMKLKPWCNCSPTVYCVIGAFLDASSHLHMRVCPSVGPWVRPSVRMSVSVKEKSPKTTISACPNCHRIANRFISISLCYHGGKGGGRPQENGSFG